MNLVIGIPVIEQVQLTRECVAALIATIIDPAHTQIVLIDNGATPAYEGAPDLPSSVSVIVNRENRGFYYPLLQLADACPSADLIGLMHNDLFLYEQGWDNRMREAFTSDPKLGLVGLTGSSEADALGGRGGGTMCYFRGERGQNQSAGARITDLRPSVLLDSLFMLFRREVIPSLRIDEHIAPCHFYDKIWSMRTIEAGYHVATLGSECDHMGGQTAVLVEQYIRDAEEWCQREGIPTNGDARQAIYLEAERRFLSEYRDEKHLIPCRIDADYTLWK